MKVDLGIWDWLSRVILVLLVLATLVGVALWYLPLIQENERWRRRIYDKEAEIRLELEKSNRLRREIESFQNPRTIERLARDKLNYARSNEIVLHFEGATTNAAPPPPGP